MTDIFLDNPFNCEEICMDIDPIYAVTAEDRDRMACLLFLPEITNLETYVEARYLFDYRKIITDAVERGDVPLNRSTKKVPCPVAARVTNCLIKWLESSRRDRAKQGVFNIDAIMVVEMDILQPEEQNQTADEWIAWQKLLASGIPLRTDHVQQWYRIRGYMDLVGSETKLAQSISIYDRKDKRGDMGYSDSLVPVLSKVDMDWEAERVLKKYGMGNAVDRCCRVDAMTLAAKMGLTVIPARLSRGNRIRGELYLHDSDAIIYENGMEHCLSVKAGTILYDPYVCDSQERIDETIIHECVHFDLHWLFYTLQREYNDCIEYLACMDSRIMSSRAEDTYEQWLEDESQGESVYAGTDSRQKRTDIEWAEWQARGMTPRIQMPAKQTIKKIESLIQKHAGRRSKGIAAVYAKVIPELASFYHVSWTAAKIRMIELGYREARGVLNYVDGGYVPAYTTSTGQIEPGTSYDISEADAERLCKSDPMFAAVIHSGKFVYVESHFCLNDQRYVRRNKTGICLTDTARQNIDHCCLLFRVRYGHRNNRYDKEALHSDDLNADPVAVALAAIPLDVMLAASQSVDELCEGLPRRFGETLKYHREQKQLTQQKLAEMLGVESKQISRWENGEVRLTQSQIGAIGVMMNLKGSFTEDLMNKAKVPININDPEDMALRFVIYYMYMRPLEECNQVLMARGCKPFTSCRSRK